MQNQGKISLYSLYMRYKRDKAMTCTQHLGEGWEGIIVRVRKSQIEPRQRRVGKGTLTKCKTVDKVINKKKGKVE